MNPHDSRYLARLGVRSLRHQEILLDAIPCGIESIKAAWTDATNVEVNSPRTLLVVYWKGMVRAFQLEETP